MDRYVRLAVRQRTLLFALLAAYIIVRSGFDIQVAQAQGAAGGDRGCSKYESAAREWCVNNAPYWKTKGQDTIYLENQNVRVGINISYGGTIFELYGRNRAVNLISEHGGAAVQLSLWGYDAAGTRGKAWFRTDACDPVARSEKGAGGAWRMYGFSSGAHIADCKNVRPCSQWSVGAPFNPIQAQGANCRWGDESNDAQVTERTGSKVTVEQRDPNNFTKSSRFPGLVIRQTVQLYDYFVHVRYDIKYSGINLTSHPQEIPAIFTGAGISKVYYVGENGSTKERPAGMLKGEKESIPGDRWWAVCDQSRKNCLTVMTPSDEATEIYLHASRGDPLGAYMTPLGNFALTNGLSLSVSVYLFPFHPDDNFGRTSVKRLIAEILAAEGRAQTPVPAPAKTAEAGKTGEQARAAFERQFKAADKNGDGGLSREELNQTEGFPVIRANFDAMDTNKDGKVTIAERDAWGKARAAERRAAEQKK